MRDTELNLSIMLVGCKSHKELCTYCKLTKFMRKDDDPKCWLQSVLVFAFQIWGQDIYQIVVNIALGGLIMIGFFGYASPVIQALLLLTLILDCTFHTIFNAIRSWSTEFGNGQIKVPWVLSKRVAIGSVYPLLVLLCVIDMAHRDMDDTGSLEICNYALALAVVIRNESLWMPISIFTQAVGAAGPVAYLFVTIVLVSSGMMLVLLHGKYDTEDFYVDSQYSDYFYSVTTMSMFMIGNITWVVSRVVCMARCYMLRVVTCLICDFDLCRRCQFRRSSRNCTRNTWTSFAHLRLHDYCVTLVYHSYFDYNIFGGIYQCCRR